jgi:hypothetical protein
MKSDNLYEAAFEAYLRRRGVAVMPIVEARRSYLDDNEVKSPDFIVVSMQNSKLVVDVKGRKFPGSGKGGKARNIWHNWCEREDIESLSRWADRFGESFRGVLAFVYHLAPHIELPRDTQDLFAYRGELYLARGVLVSDYRAHMRTRSPRWGTVYLLSDDFRELVKPISHFLTPAGVEFTLENAEQRN